MMQKLSLFQTPAGVILQGQFSNQKGGRAKLFLSQLHPPWAYANLSSDFVPELER